MKLSSLISAEDKLIGPDLDVLGLCHNSKKVKSGYAFFALSGYTQDGKQYIAEAIKNGASAVITDQEINKIDGVSVVKTPNARSAMAQMASKFYGTPQSSMKFVMITGTNGKTTTTYMIKSILDNAGIKAGIIGTNGAFWGEKLIETGMTTPDPIELFSLLETMRNDGVQVVVMEASAHALALNKLDGLYSDISVLTNITEDHLDFFKTMEEYSKAKFKLFNKDQSKTAVVCIDDLFSQKLFNSLKIPAISCGFNKSSNIKAELVANNIIGQSFCVSTGSNIREYHLQLDGEFNIKNALCAICVAKLLKVKEEDIINGLASLSPVPGRFNRINVNGIKVVIDFAHTPDGVLNVLNAGEKLAGKNKLIAVFGCGGNRDKQKRPIMGEIASSKANFCYITSDNPRSENPSDIIEDIASGINNNNYVKMEDRAAAIRAAINSASDGDVVMILGKGCENYMEINGIKHPYSDYSVVQQIIEENKNK